MTYKVTYWDNETNQQLERDTTPEETADINARKLAGLVPKVPAEVVAALWQAAHDYEYAQISGSAIGLVTMGVIQGKPKCMAVQNWINSIWVIYYARKASNSTDTDFSVAGLCPHNVPELMAELAI